LFNRGQTSANITANFSDLKVAGKHRVRDLWKHEERGSVENAFSDGVPAHSVVLIRVTSQSEGR
jgi:alpha-galactosidase